jgi:glucose-like phosphotransferase system IIB component
MHMEAITQPQAKAMLQALGGAENVIGLETCFTRLRIEVKDKNRVKIKALQAAPGCCGVVEREDTIQLVYGIRAAEIETVLRALCMEKGKGIQI